MNHRSFISPIGREGIYILDTASWRALRPVLDSSRCIGCGLCMAYCPVNSVVRTGEKQFEISYEYCKGCGICARECPKQAITMAEERGNSK